MKLLLDQNLSHRLVASLSDVFPGSQHVRDLGLATASDADVWDAANRGGFAILSKDGDFRQLSFVHGAPPKVVWLRVGNSSTKQIEAFVRAHLLDLARFEADQTASILVLG